MSLQKKPFVYWRLLIVLVSLLLGYQVMRLIFFLVNHAYFPDTDVLTFLKLSFAGIRFDLSMILSINALFWIWALLPVLHKRAGILFIRFVFVITNGLLFLAELADIAYFPFTRKRMSGEVLHLLSESGDSWQVIPSYLLRFPYIPFVFLLGIFLLWRLSYWPKDTKVVQPAMHLLLSLVILGFIFLGIRGGWQLKPLLINHALLYGTANQAPLVLNTGFTITRTLGKVALKPVNLLPVSEAIRIIQPIKEGEPHAKFKPMNVMVIMVESLGWQYTGYGGRVGVTPFIDSLMHQGRVYYRAFANGHRSADGVPACLSGIPAFMDEPFTTSPYSSNPIESLPACLHKMGYSSAFFHGGSNGTMSLDVYARSASFKQYFGRDEYGNENDYDGAWGIWDQPFLQYTARTCNELPKPFMASVFTLSSHEPFRLPNNYKPVDSLGGQGILQGMAYTDNALRQFFEKLSTYSWYNQTLFVITADHQFLANQDPGGYYNQGIGLFHIPIIYFCPGDESLKGFSKLLTQQIDILPSVLDYLNYPFRYYALGNSVFNETSNRFSFHYVSNTDYFQTKERVLMFTNRQITGYFDRNLDTLLRQSLGKDSLYPDAVRQYQAFTQILNYSLINNKMKAENYQSPAE